VTDAIAADFRLGIVRGITYGMFGKPDRFVPRLRELGADLVRVNLFWSQIEPVRDRFTFDVLDALLEQLDGSEEVWIALCSSSSWATRHATDLLPPSPAIDLDRYYRFVHRVVGHCRGRVRYWQCDNEPSDGDLLWTGTAEEYVAQMKVMYRAVKDADPAAAVVLGGAPYSLPLSAPHSGERRFFEVLLREGGDHFDVFDLHLYGSADRIVDDIDGVRDLMRAHGLDKPVVVGEYHAPWPGQFPEAMEIVQRTMAESAAAPATGESTLDDGLNSTQRAMSALYERMPTLPPTLQMFMTGCSEDLEARRHRMASREIVVRNLLALSAGVRRTACWNLAPEAPGFRNPLSMPDLLFGKFSLLDYDDSGELSRRYPAADAFALLARQLAGTRTVTRRRVDRPARVELVEVEREGRDPLLVVWQHRDPFHGEDEPPVQLTWPWPAGSATAVDAFGAAQPVDCADGQVTLPVSATPLYVEVG
jgi:hypothetical protein